MSSVLKDNPLDKMLLESYINESLLMLTLSDRKVYVASVLSLGEPTETTGMSETVEILPAMSGYRDKDTLCVDFTTDYNSIEEELSLTIRYADISQCTEFDFDIYSAINRSAEKPKKLYY